MKKNYPFLLLALILASCAPAIDIPATQTAIFSTAMAEAQKQYTKPTETPIPVTPVEPQPIVETAVVSIPDSGDILLDDAFDSLEGNWTEAIWVTSFSNVLSKSTMGLEQGWLTFNLPDKSPILYAFNKNIVEKNVVIETISQISGPVQTEISIACRANADFSKWIDFRVIHNNEYAIYAYDRSLVNSGANPFSEIIRSSFQPDILKPGEQNKIRATCIENQFSLEINDTMIGNATSDAVNEAGTVGLGGIGVPRPPTIVYFDYVKVMKPAN